MSHAGVLVDEQGVVETGAAEESLRRRLRDRQFFWLDLHAPAAHELERLADVFRFHPLAVEDAEEFGQRPKLEEYEGFVLLVVYGATDETADRLAEVHCFCSPNYLVTVHQVEVPALEELREHYRRRQAADADGAMLLYHVVDVLVDSFFLVLTQIEDRIERLEDVIFAEGPDDGQLRDIFALKQLLLRLRKVVLPQRDVFARVASGVAELPAMTRETERYYRDLYDHLIRIGDLLENDRDLVTGVADIYLSTSSNRLNIVMKQLSVIATVFLPLSFLVGFFGQNFGWLVRNIGGATDFVVLGIGTEVVSVGLMVVLFRKRGWL